MTILRLSKGLVTKCEHEEEPHYAKGMCFRCYHRKGRTKLATACPHRGKAVGYALGLCSRCYYRRRNRKDRRRRKK